MEKPKTDRLGVAALDLFFSKQGWLFREQTTHDYGIDAHIEIVKDGRPTGKLIALQIKTGRSFFTETDGECFVFRTKENHVAYWVGHSMPVLVVLYDPDNELACWCEVARNTVESTGKGWKIKIPNRNVLDDADRTLRFLTNLTQPEPYIRRLNRLRVDRRWMEILEAGGDVNIQFNDWVNKSLPRYQ